MLVLNIGASLLAFFSFIKFLDGVVMWFGHFAGADELSFSYILGYAMYPIAWLIGIDLQVETDTLHSIHYLWLEAAKSQCNLVSIKSYF